MATIENVTAARLIACDIEGVGLVNLMVRTITIKESVCCPYLTGEILLLDNDNYLNNSQLQGGSRIDIRFDGAGYGSGPAYEALMYVLHVTAVPSPENFDLRIYTISMVSSEYFTDRGQTVSINTSGPGETGCSLIRDIWTQCMFQVPLTQVDQDMPFQDGNQPYTCTMAKPFTAIGQIRDIQVYPKMDGNVMFFHNRIGSVHQVVHGPLSTIYPTAAASETFLQRQTWGIKWNHPAGPPPGSEEFVRAIININDQSRAIMLDPDQFSVDKQIAVSTDQNSAKLGSNIMFPGVAQGAGVNIPSSNSDRVDPSHDPYNIIANARRFAHCMKAVPKKYLVKVPLKTGLNITAGGGCTLDLQPTHDNPNGTNPNSGSYWITDLIHEVNNDLREVSGTTTFNCLRQGACV